MKVAIAIDSFKGSIGSVDAGNAAADGVRRVFPSAECFVSPLADGGEGAFDPDPTTARILARAHNQPEMLQDATAHAEMLALTAAASAKGAWRLSGTRLYVTKEPCPMCAGAIILARVPTVVWGVSDPKRGGGTVFNIFGHPGINHHPEIVTGVLEEESRTILQNFFRKRREEKDA